MSIISQKGRNSDVECKNFDMQQLPKSSSYLGAKKKSPSFEDILTPKFVFQQIREKEINNELDDYRKSKFN